MKVLHQWRDVDSGRGWRIEQHPLARIGFATQSKSRQPGVGAEGAPLDDCLTLIGNATRGLELICEKGDRARP